MKYKCLVLDHDDTTVRSTPDIHYPQWLETLALMRPDVEMDIETFMRYNFEFGFFEMCRSVLNFTEEEKAKQYVLWKKYTETHTASFYEGMPELIRAEVGDEDFSVELIGLCTDICVVSNALILKAAFPEAEISVDAKCCAGVTVDSHKAALLTMQFCQIDIKE